MKKIQDKPGGRPAKKRTEKQKKVVSTKLTELQYYPDDLFTDKRDINL